MNDRTVTSVHWSYWAISVVALIWNVMGATNFVVQTNENMLAAYSEAERAIIEGRPLWATAGFVAGVFGGALGCLLLLLRKSVAYYLFVASLLGVIVTHIHTLGVASKTITLGAVEFSAILMTLVVAVFLIWYSKRAESRGWIS